MNMHQGLTFVLLLSLALSVTVFSFAQTQTPPAPAAPQEEPLPALAVPKNYHYNSHGRRDPFVNPVPKPKTSAVSSAVPKRPPGLRGILVEEAQIAGVVTSREPSMNVVIISAPGVRTPYFAHIGDELYDARVKSIKLDTVTFALNVPNGADAKTPREIVRKVRPKSGEDR